MRRELDENIALNLTSIWLFKRQTLKICNIFGTISYLMILTKRSCIIVLLQEIILLLYISPVIGDHF